MKHLLPLLVLAAGCLRAGSETQMILLHQLVGSRIPDRETDSFNIAQVPSLPAFHSVREWQDYAARLRETILDQVVFRGEAKKWRALKTRVEWLDTIQGGVGYHIRKLRFEAVPGLSIPALLYEPDDLRGKVPAILNVNGHEAGGNVVENKQVRCINQARRGMLALSVEWLGMGQLKVPDLVHTRMNQLDLTGTSGFSIFYLSLSRSLDVLLSHPHADPTRVAVTGHSGGGLQSIYLSALDPRIQLSVPVAGYASYVDDNAGDSEHSPTDLGKYADFRHLTAMVAPRPLLLTYNAKEDCCFRVDHVLSTLYEAARPIYHLFGREDHLRFHVNYDPGTHNYDQDNREALYQAIADYFYPGGSPFDSREIPCRDELKTAEQLAVPLPDGNATFNTIARSLAAKAVPAEATASGLREIVRFRDLRVEASAAPEAGHFWRLRVAGAFTVPAVEFGAGPGKPAVVVLADDGRASAWKTVDRLVAAGRRVLAIDPYGLGEYQIWKRDMILSLQMAALGQRPLGIDASELAAVSRWWKLRTGAPVTVLAIGPRSSLMALVAAVLERDAIAGLELHRCLPTLQNVIASDWDVEAAPEMFCFGLFPTYDIPRLLKLVGSRPVERAAE